MTIERAKRLAKKWANGYVCSLREGEAEEYHKLCFSALQEQQEQESNARMTVAKLRKFASAKPPVCGGNWEYTSPCDLCAYNPPSSFDGKPCAMCPATSMPEEGEEE